MSDSEKITASEMVESLTGFEEIAIERHMGIDPYADGERKPMKVMRALVFTQATREGMDAAKARERAMSLSMSEVQELFADDETEIDGETPETEAGKDATPSD